MRLLRLLLKYGSLICPLEGPRAAWYFNELYNLKKDSGLKGFSIKSFLSDTNAYKKELLQEILPVAYCKEPAEKLLTSQLPKFFWVIRIRYEDLPISDLIYDATTNIKKERIKVDFV